MKKRFGREIFWLSLPVALLGVMAFSKTRGGRLPAFKVLSALDTGLRRLEFSPMKPLELTPLDVSSGYSWGVETSVWGTGRADVPSSWRANGGLAPGAYALQLVYRQGTQWKKISNSAIGVGIGGDNFTIKVKLKDIPRDADEVRLKGRFEQLEIYKGVIPPGWVNPPKVTHFGLNHYFTLSSKPFDLAIVGEGHTRPEPEVSHQQKVAVVEGKWLRDIVSREYLLLKVRAKPDSGLTGELSCRVDDLKYFDAQGKPVIIYQDATSIFPAAPQGAMRQWVSPDLPANEDVARLTQFDAQPRRGWNSVKMPITVTGMVSDGKCWPAPFKVQMAPEPGDPKDYGAPQKQTPRSQ